MTQKERVFLLSKIPYRDSDLVVNFLSAANGKLSSIVYRGRKIGGKSDFTSEPGALLEIEYRIKENKDFIQLLNFNNISQKDFANFSLNQFYFHSYLLELTSRISHPGDPATELFEILTIYNNFPWVPQERLIFIGWILWQIIKQGGYAIDFHSCVNCGCVTWQKEGAKKPSFRKETYQLAENSGHLICSKCQPPQESEKTISAAIIKIFWLFDSTNDFEMMQQRIPMIYIVSTIKLLNQYLLESFEISLKSLPLFLLSLNSE